MAIVKIPYAIKDRLDERIDYAINPKKTELDEHLMYADCINCTGIDTAYEEMRNVKRFYGKEGGVLGYSFIQSFKPGEVTPQIAHEIGMRLAQEYFGDRYQAVVGTHLDKGHLHNHIVVNSVSLEDGRKYRNHLQYLGEIRELSDKLCEEYELSVIKSKRRKRTISHTQWEEQQAGIPSRNDLLRSEIDTAIDASASFQEFVNYLRNRGYEVKFGSNVKYMTITPPGGKAKRVYRLGEQYSEQAIRERIMQGRERLYKGEEIAVKRLTVKRRRAMGNPRKAKTRLTGWRALYYRYLYQLGVIKKRPLTCSRRVSYLLRDDLRKFEQYRAQYRFLNEHGIDTKDQLMAYRERVEAQMQPLYDRRKALYSKKRTVKDETALALIREECTAISEALKPMRKALRMCDAITERSQKVREAARMPLYPVPKRVQREQKHRENRRLPAFYQGLF